MNKVTLIALAVVVLLLVGCMMWLVSQRPEGEVNPSRQRYMKKLHCERVYAQCMKE
jgi:hypothetical protein